MQANNQIKLFNSIVSLDAHPLVKKLEGSRYEIVRKQDDQRSGRKHEFLMEAGSQFQVKVRPLPYQEVLCQFFVRLIHWRELVIRLLKITVSQKQERIIIWEHFNTGNREKL